MANADGSVIFFCDLDSTKAQKKLSKLRDEISELNSKLEKETGNKMNLEKQLDAASQAAKATEERVKMLRKEVERLNDREWIQKQGFTQNEYQTQVLDRRAAAEAELKQQEELLHTQTKEVKTLSAAYEETTANIDSMTARLDKHLTTVCLQSDKGQVKQLSLYSHTVFFATLRRTLRATVHFGAHTWESGVLIRSCARMHSSVLIREHLLSEKLTFALDGHGSAYEQHLSDRRLHDRVESIISVHSVTSMLCISSLTDTPDRSATKEKRVPR